MTPNEKLAVLTALKKMVDEQLKEIRKAADTNLLYMYDNAGVEKMAIKFGDTKVGEVLITFKAEEYEVVDHELFDEFALLNGLAKEKYSIEPLMVNSVIEILESLVRTGDLDQDYFERMVKREVVLNSDWDKYFKCVGDVVILDGTTETVPGVECIPRQLKGTMVRGCKPQEVIPVVQKLGGFDQLLLGAGDE